MLHHCCGDVCYCGSFMGLLIKVNGFPRCTGIDLRLFNGYLKGYSWLVKKYRQWKLAVIGNYMYSSKLKLANKIQLKKLLMHK